jgi:hypothetical protein
VAGGAEERSWSDGETIFLTGDGDRDAVVVQAALIAAGTFADPKVVARTTGRRALRLRFLTLETMRAMHELGDLLPRSIIRRVGEVYDADPPASAAESFKRANGREKVPEAPAWMGTIKPSKVVLNSGIGGSAASKEELEKGPKDDVLREIDDEEESETSKIMDLFSTPLPRNPISDAIQKFLGAGRSPKPDGSGGDEVASSGSRIGRVGENAQEARAPADLDLGLFLPPLGRAYPEWDWQKERYRPDHCFVSEYDPRMDDSSPPTPLDDGNDPRLRRELARLGLAHERHRRQVDGDALDMTALTEYVVDRAIGGSVDDRVYERGRRTAHDLGVVVLLDVTGSTSDSDEGRRVFDDQRQIAARLIATLAELGDRVAGYGFQSWGRNGVRFLRIKEFDDRWDLSSQRRLAAMEPGGFTRLGAAVRHGTHIVTDKSGCINTLLIVVGDGLPYDDGYEHRYAQEDSARALSEAVDAGVGCACLSVKTATEPDILQRVWGHVPYIHLERVADLHREVMPVFRRGLREAALTGRDGRR